MRNPGPNWLMPSSGLPFRPSRRPVRRFSLIAHDLLVEPGARVRPVALGRGAGNAESRGGLLNSHAREVAQLDQLGLDRILGRKLVQGFVKGQQVLDRFGRGELRLVELLPW